MNRYSIELRNWIFVKGYGLLPSAKNMSRKIGKNLSKNLSDKTARNFLIILRNLLKMHLKLLQKSNSKYSRNDQWLQRINHRISIQKQERIYLFDLLNINQIQKM